MPRIPIDHGSPNLAELIIRIDPARSRPLARDLLDTSHCVGDLAVIIGHVSPSSKTEQKTGQNTHRSFRLCNLIA